MYVIWRMVAVWLVMSVACTLISAQPPLLLAAQGGHAAGCHDGQGPTSPSPALPSPVPKGYECCVSGHHAAIPSAAFSFRSATVGLSVNRGDVREGNFVPFILSSRLVVFSSSPPGAVPLRI
jgi:hypothetical protein